MVCLPDGEKTLICSAISTEYRRVTDGRTHGQTSCHSIVRAMHIRRAIKMLGPTVKCNGFIPLSASVISHGFVKRGW